jgi:hypothetical protein
MRRSHFQFSDWVRHQDQGNHSPQGVLHFRRLETALRRGDAARIVLPNNVQVKEQPGFSYRLFTRPRIQVLRRSVAVQAEAGFAWWVRRAQGLATRSTARSMSGTQINKLSTRIAAGSLGSLRP